jgi:polyisoprenoid-binding protein YceI
MKAIAVLLVLLTWGLAACSPGPATTEAKAAPTEAAPAQAGQSAPTEEATLEAGAPVAESTGEDAVLVLKIVPGESSLSYEVGETFLSENNKFATAIGVTTAINGEISINRQSPQNSAIGVITADISQFESDSSRRDSKIQNDFLESAKFPIVTFSPTGLTGFPENPQEGQEYGFQVTGDTTIRATTLPLTFDVTATFAENSLSGVATTTFLMSDFGFGPISIAGILETEDEVKISFNFVARP